MPPSAPSTTLLLVFGLTTIALAFGVPLLLLRERVDKPWRFGVVGALLYLGIGFGVRGLLLRDAIDPAALGVDLANGDLSVEEHATALLRALEVRAQSTRTGMGIGLMSAIGFAWMVRIVAGRRLEQFASTATLPRLVVGCACDLCSDTIALELEGKHCATCGVTLHKRCAAKHRAAMHPHDAPTKKRKKKPRASSLAPTRSPRALAPNPTFPSLLSSVDVGALPQLDRG